MCGKIILKLILKKYCFRGWTGPTASEWDLRESLGFCRGGRSLVSQLVS
jgi:hypothetical protein